MRSLELIAVREGLVILITRVISAVVVIVVVVVVVIIVVVAASSVVASTVVVATCTGVLVTSSASRGSLRGQSSSGRDIVVYGLRAATTIVGRRDTNLRKNAKDLIW